VRRHDSAALELALADSRLPAEAQAGIREGYRQLAAADFETQTSFLTSLRSEFEQRAALAAAQAQRGVATAFSEAITLVYTYVLFIVVAGWLTTFLIPELPLSRSHGPPRAVQAAD
jgi:hypothetical protein